MNFFKKNQRLVFTAFFLLACSAGYAQKQINIQSSYNEERKDQLVVIARPVLEKKLGVIAKGKYVIFKKETGMPLVVQYDDLNGDGKWDEVAFLYSFKPKENVTLKIEPASSPATIKAMVRAHVRQMKKNVDNSFGPSLDKDTMPVNAQPTDFSKQALPPYLTEGPAWENDKVGFRLYFDVRNGKDIWGKTTTRMVLDEVGADTSKNYHHLADWGMDILKVGPSLGAGSLALKVPLSNGKDTLVRLGGNNIGKVTYEKVADGPVRAICRLKYTNWTIAKGMAPVTVTEEIHIWGGQYFYESHVWVTGAPKGAKLVTGIVNLHSHQMQQINTAGNKVIYTYDVQSENNDRLGIAVVMLAAQAAGTATAPNANTDIQNTYLMLANLINDKPVLYRFYACWEKSDDRFTTEDGFRRFMIDETKNTIVNDKLLVK